MDCSLCREALSARVDGEAEPVPASVVDEHVRTCASCRTWHEDVIAQRRALRVRTTVPVPDLSRAILADAPEFVPARGLWRRYALGGVAVAQLALALAQFFGVGEASMHAPMATHLFNEGTAWNLALGVGLFWAAFRPRTASGLIPVLTGFVVLLLAYSTHDLITGTAPVTRVLGHGLLVAGLILLILVHRTDNDANPGHTTADDTGEVYDADETPAESTQDGRPGSARPPLRPASRHRAA